MDFGILTLATPSDYRKAIGLALSARTSNPRVPIAVACSKAVGRLLSPYFDYIIEEDQSLKGFEHKVHLDRYSPFGHTFYFDADVLLFRDLTPLIEVWAAQPYTACGEYASERFSSFGLDREYVLGKIRKERLVMIDGAGHAFFTKPGCRELFDLARTISAEYREAWGGIKYADEDVVDIAMTILDLKPMPRSDFFSRYCSAVRGSLEMDAASGKCAFIAVDSNRLLQPYMMHFAANEAPFAYTRQLERLFKAAGVDTSGLYATAFADFFESQIKWPFKKFLTTLIPEHIRRSIAVGRIPNG